ncbi:hypothetical protein [Calothrix sp. NIES-2100]
MSDYRLLNLLHQNYCLRSHLQNVGKNITSIFIAALKTHLQSVKLLKLDA